MNPRRWLALFACIGALLTTVPARAQTRRPISEEGTEAFRALLAGKQAPGRGLIPLGSVEEVRRLNPNEVLVIAFRGGDENGARPDSVQFILSRDLDLGEFFNRGGAFFLATDQATDRALKHQLDVRVDGSRLEAAFDHPGFHDRRQCPFIAQRADTEPNLFIGTNGPLTRVATNKPSFLERRSKLDTIAVFPFRSVVPVGLRFNELEIRQFAFAQIGVAKDMGGQVLVLADHSIFINSMMLHWDPNDNLAFAANCVDWLITRPDGERRKYVLFIEDGHVWQPDDYNLELRTLPQPNPEDIAAFLWDNRDILWQNTDFAEALLSQMEQDGVFDAIERSDILSQLVNNLVPPWAASRIILLLGAAGLLFYGLRAFVGSKFGISKKNPRLATLLDRMRPRTGLLELRLRSGLGRGRYYELARQKAREMFADFNLTPADDGALPHVTIDAVWWRRNAVMRDLRHFWQVAFGREPVAVTARQWTTWLKKLNRISLLIRNGDIRFA